MKKVFFTLLAVGALTACNKESSCTCGEGDTAVTTTCTDCSGDENDAFETACEASGCTVD